MTIGSVSRRSFGCSAALRSDVDKAEKKRLKQLGKQVVADRSKKLLDDLGKTNPAEPLSDEYIRNEIAIREKERMLRQAADRTQPRWAIEKHFVLHAVEPDFERPGFAPNDYWSCAICEEMVPSQPAVALSCACGNIYIEPVKYAVQIGPDGGETIQRVSAFKVRDRANVQYVRLLGAVRH